MQVFYSVKRSLTIALVVIGVPILTAVPVRAETGAELLAEKNLEIRNLRRAIFDLESQLPAGAQEQKLMAEIKRLKDEHRREMNEQAATHADVLKDSKERLKQLEKELSLQKKSAFKAQDEGQAAQYKIRSELEGRLQKKDQQLIESNEVLTRVMAERAQLEDRLRELQSEVEQQAARQKDSDRELKKLQSKRDKVVKKAQKPLQEKIAALEEDLTSLRKSAHTQSEQYKLQQEQQARQFNEEKVVLRQQLKDKFRDVEQWEQQLQDYEAKYQEERREFERRLADLDKQLKKSVADRLATESQLAEVREALRQSQHNRSDLETSLKEQAAEQKDQLQKEQVANRDSLKVLRKQLAEYEEMVKGLRNQLAKNTENYQRELASVKADLKSKEQAVRIVEERVVQAQVPLNEKLDVKQKENDKLQIQLKAAKDNAELLRSQLQDKDEKIVVYKKLVDKQEGDLEKFRNELAKESAEFESTIAAERAPLQKRIEGLNKEITALNKKLQVQRMGFEQEYNAEKEALQKELSSVKIDLEYQTNAGTKLKEAKGQLENTLLALQKKNDALMAELTKVSKTVEGAQDAWSKVREAQSAEAELRKRNDILLQENADYQEKVLELTQSLQGITDAKQMATQLAEAQDIIMGFKKDVDAKTIEISGLVTENHDLRKKLRKTIKEADGLKETVDSLKRDKLAQISDKDIEAQQEQINSLRTALSTARQLIAQKDVLIEDMAGDQEVLRGDVAKLSEQLNEEIRTVGELEHAKRNNFGGFSEDELQEAKKPLLLEISVLKQRVAQLEEQLVETWNRAEGMLLELKNHPQIKQADGKLMLEDMPSLR